MKFQIVFLSLLVTAHARYEPKGLRGGDDRDLELGTVQINHIIPEGGSATIHCGSGSQCCVASSFKVVNDTRSSEWGSVNSCNDAITVTDGTASMCQMEVCTISCDSPSCKVDFEAGSAGRGGFGGPGQPGGMGGRAGGPGQPGGMGGRAGGPGEPGGMGGHAGEPGQPGGMGGHGHAGEPGQPGGMGGHAGGPGQPGGMGGRAGGGGGGGGGGGDGDYYMEEE